jgi:DNA-directed RNA polymerase subunit RPC12/RpoP
MTDDPKQRPWPVRGFAPGGYMVKCLECVQTFMGDKRAYHCPECALTWMTTHRVPALLARADAAEAERDTLRREMDDAKLLLSEMRMCVNCGRRTGSDHNRAMPLPDCTSPDACTFDLTPDEAWLYWRQIAHDVRVERDDLRAKLAEAVGALEAAQESIATFMGVHGYPTNSGAADVLRQVNATLALITEGEG